MNPDAILTAITVVSVLGLLAATRLPADVVLLAAMAFLILTGVLSSQEAVAGFSNTGVLTVAVLYVVVAGLRETGAVSWVAQRLLGRPRGTRTALARLMLPTIAFSAFLNNTPIVAMMIPALQEWARRIGIPVSKLLLPLSYAAIVGGLCTLIGTSTNLVVNGLLMSRLGQDSLGLFAISAVALPLAALTFIYMLTVGTWLIPARGGAIEQLENAREYSIEMRVEPHGPLVGKSIAQAGLRNMPNIYLAEIQRGPRLIGAVEPDEVLQAGDLLVFVGVTGSIKEMRRIHGLSVQQNQSFRLDIRHSQRRLIEVVLASGAPVVGQTIRDGRFRSRYNAVILSVSRNGIRLPGKLGDIVLQPGDTLLVEAAARFAQRNRYNRDFLLVAEVADSRPPNTARAPLALLILAAMVASGAFGWLSFFEAGLLAAGLMVISRCLPLSVARSAIDLPLLLVIAASFALGAAMDNSGLARSIASALLGATGGPLAALVSVYFLTVLFTELITNNAAAVLMFPIAVSTAAALQVSHMPFVVAIMVGASASFITPIGYQTNLMVYGPGGYRFSDYVRVGLPLSLLVAAAAVALIVQFFPFS
ncbi:MAG: SLC13 family permease [Spirochaetaceae bacterium]|nr:MAG: SLC13 family permease [Spirochaetaceae bacterium]